MPEVIPEQFRDLFNKKAFASLTTLMLRHPEASSPINDFTRDSFLNVLPDSEVSNAERILLCTGKIGHELKVERKKRKDRSTAIVFVDQMYPFPEAELSVEFERHPAAEIVWVQEEPGNMGLRIGILN